MAYGSLPTPPVSLPGSTGGSIEAVGNPDLSMLAGRSPADATPPGQGAQASLKYAFQAESAIDSWIAATPADDESGSDTDSNSIRSELAEIKARLHEIAIRAVPDKRAPSADLTGPVGPMGEGKSRF